MKKYQSYKDSGVEWIGKIPSHWNVKNLKYSYNIQKGKLPKRQEEEPFEDSIPYLSMDVVRGNKTKSYTTIDDGVFIKSGDVGILWDGSNSGEIIKFNQEGILSSTISKLSNIDNELDPLFGFYLLKFLESDFRNHTIGMGIPHMDGDHLKYSTLIIPTLPEQQQIVTYLDQKTQKIDDLIKHKKRKIELLKEKRISLINRVVTKGLDPHVEMKDSGVEWIGEIPRHWEIIPLKFLGKFQNGISKGSEFFGKGLPFMNYGDVYKNEVTPKLVEGKVESDEIERDRYSVRKGDVFFTRTSETKDDIGVTSTCLKTIDNCVFSGFVIRFRFYEDTHFPEFSRYHFQSHWKKVLIESKMNIVTRSSLSQRVLGQVPVLIPPSKEQNQIVNYLNSHTNEIDDLISMEQKKIKLLKEYRQSIISEVVTGKRRVCKEDHSVELKNEMV